MHREIEFRGKRIDNGEWVYGYYYEHSPPMQGIVPKDYVSEKPESYILRTGFADWNMDRPIDFTGVYPETIGQYTGLKDKNGIEIYEGDVVCNRWGNYYTPIFRNGIYMAYNIEWSHWMQQEPSTQFNVIWKEGCEVIGNIHDNPELLEVK